MDKWLKTGTLKRSASRTEIRPTDLAAMRITVDQQDDSHEVQRPTDWPIQLVSWLRWPSGKVSASALESFQVRNPIPLKIRH
ncbi:hypothetical protein AVEN_52842-1 [Araneus ventricosus]|uniref:Uncharacterized protein n=1 Tax=Araneus ventricosus TaxID=182803 RepID=A0A4Y2RJI4_ARAVE|nr:hypothetical protein AVEN_52842-1 [Araneus ventricosus]